MKGIRANAVYLVTAAILFLILAFIADFSLRQSTVLALLLALLARGIENAAPKPTLRFTPYWVRVSPKWDELLTDFKLIPKLEEWDAIWKRLKELPPTEYHVLSQGMCFTVLRRSDDFTSALIYSNNHHVFVSEVDFEEDMEPIHIERESPHPSLRRWDVRFFLKSGRYGYDLGIVVPDSWWDEMRASCAKPMEAEKVFDTGRTRLTLATISRREFDLYTEPLEWSSTFYEKTAKQIRDQIDDQRKKFGWETEQHLELPATHWPESIEHKYFNVEHGGI